MTDDIHILEEIHLKTLESLPDAVVVINETGEIVLFNLRAEVMFGYSREEVLGKEVEVLLPESFKIKHVYHRQTYFDEPGVREMGAGLILKGLHKRGREFSVQIRLANFPVTGAGTHAVAVVRKAATGDK